MGRLLEDRVRKKGGSGCTNINVAGTRHKTRTSQLSAGKALDANEGISQIDDTENTKDREGLHPDDSIQHTVFSIAKRLWRCA